MTPDSVTANGLLFTGFDSAWGGKLPGAMCDIQGKIDDGRLSLRIVENPVLVNWSEATARVADIYGNTPNHIIAIDQGLVVPNAKGMREVERKIAKALMSGFKCGAHASNTSNNNCYGPNAGIWAFLERLVAANYRHSPMAVARQAAGRFFLECYPHPALIGIFDLERLLPYKIAKGDRKAWKRLVSLLRSLEQHELALCNVGQFIPHDLEQNKRNEDRLDSIIAAYIAAFLWWFGTTRSVVLGRLADGYLVTPFSKRTLNRYRSVFDEREINEDGDAPVFRPAGSEGHANPGADLVGKSMAPTNTILRRSDFDGTDELTATDTGNLWCKSNEWMIRDHCEGWSLNVRLTEFDGEPVIRFIPFKKQGIHQVGMRPADADTRQIWQFVTQGATRENPQRFHVDYWYDPLSGDI